MKTKTRWILWTVGGALWILAFVAGVLFGTRQAQPQAALPLLAEVVAALEQDYYGPSPATATTTRAAVRGLLRSFEDERTFLLDPEPAQQELLQLSGNYNIVDVGLHLWWDMDGRIGLTPYPNGPAAQAGVLADDVLLSIDGVTLLADVPYTDHTLTTVLEHLRGPEGSTVTLTVERLPQTTFTMIVTRTAVPQPSVSWRIPRSRGDLAYLRLSTITDQTPQEVETALQTLQARGVTGIVLDMRDNPGGVLAPLPHLLGLFLGEGQVIYRTATRDNEQVTFSAGAVQFTGPLIVLINNQTASAAEIIVAALAENGRAPLLGQTTYGKGSIQSVYPLRDGSSLHLTSAVWLTPQGHPLERGGLAPTLTAEDLLPSHGYPPWLDVTIEAGYIFLENE